MYTRHHGFSLLSHALLGALVLWRNLMDTEFGFISSVVLAAFHGGAVAAHTWLQGATQLCHRRTRCCRVCCAASLS